MEAILRFYHLRAADHLLLAIGAICHPSPAEFLREGRAAVFGLERDGQRPGQTVACWSLSC